MIAIWRVNMRIFGNADDLPEEIEVKINALIKKIEQIDYLGEISMYYGYPFCNLLEYLTQRDIQTKNSGVNVRYRGKHRFFKGFNEFIKEKTRRCDNDFEKIERHVFF